MRIRVRDAGSVRILELEGDLTGIQPTEMTRTVHDLLRDGHREILLDLEGVRRWDAGGLAEFYAVTFRVREAGGDLNLITRGPGWATMSGQICNPVWEYFPDTESALACLAKKRPG